VSAPSSDDFKTYFDREFAYGDGMDTVRNSDVIRALGEAGVIINPDLWDDVTAIGALTEYKIAFLYLTAHILSKSIQAAGGLSARKLGLGVRQTGDGVIESKAAAGLQVGYAQMNLARESPILSQFLETPFGKKYLEMLYPRLVARVALVSGRSPWSVGTTGQIMP